ncbi:MAG: protein kinase [Chloroflexi bacterium]|nr:protein kinase [Chloroflexota bacterium]MBP7043898.1 protein kinase [Chloroflexota bacterium]
MDHAHHHHDNPFFNRQRITDPAYFCGRGREVEALYSAIATRQSRSVVGERKMGKSSLLTHLSCPDSLRAHGFDPQKFVFIYVDLEGMANVAYDEFWPEILDRLEMALPDGQDALQEMVADLAGQADVRFMQVRRLLRRVERAGLTVVMMLDEFESLASNPAFSASFYGELRSLAGELGMVYITASKRSLYDLTYQHADTLSSPFFNIFSEQQLGLLPVAEADALLAQMSGLAGQRPFLPAQIASLIQLAGPHPFFLNLAGSYLYDLRREPIIDDVLVETVARRFKAEAEDHFRYLWNQLEQPEQAALRLTGTATSDMVQRLSRKALLRENADGRFQPFSQAFAEFLARAEPTERPSSSTNPRAVTDLTGTTLGNYRVLSPVGRGGMAVVYQGYQSSLDRYVAIKVMSHQLAHDQTFIDRFQREAAGVAQLRHQNIVQMVDFGVKQDISYMVMEFIDGETLKERLVGLNNGNGRMPLDEVVSTVVDIAAALDYAHAHGIIHRDVKPANILLRREERLARLTGGRPFTAVLTDFGVARMLEGVQLTGTGATIGTPDYMSPEQARGQAATAASDVYALSIVLYEMLTGELPFTADTPVAMLLQHMQAVPPSVLLKVPELPSNLEMVLLRGLAKNPVDRFPTAGQLADNLRVAVGGRL